MKESEIVREILRLDGVIKNYRSKNKLKYYNRTKVHLKQMEFHKCQKRNRWVFGGNRSGKTECVKWKRCGERGAFIRTAPTNRQSAGSSVSAGTCKEK